MGHIHPLADVRSLLYYRLSLCVLLLQFEVAEIVHTLDKRLVTLLNILPKKSDLNKPRNYHGITMLYTLNKITKPNPLSCAAEARHIKEG